MSKTTQIRRPMELIWRWPVTLNRPDHLHARPNADVAEGTSMPYWYVIEEIANNQFIAWYQGDHIAKGTLAEMMHACQRHDDTSVARSRSDD